MAVPRLENWLWPPQGMCLGIEDEFVQADDVGRREYEIEVLERLGEPEALSSR